MLRIGEKVWEELCREGMLVSEWREKLEEKKRRIKCPWSGVCVEGRCKSIRKNGGLYTQCERWSESEYCVGCSREKEKNGELKYGTVYDRMKVGIYEYKDKKGNGPVKYSEIMKKEKISKEDVLAEGKRLGIEVAMCHFEEKEGKRGRPRKEKDVKEVVEKKKRGRPKKEKVVSNNVGEELIASLLSEKREMSNVSNEKELIVENNVESSVGCEEEVEEETCVVKFEIRGKIYLKSDDNVLYDMNSHDAIGIWNEETNEIVELADEDE